MAKKRVLKSEKNEKSHCCSLDEKRVALSLGLLFAIYLLVLSLLANFIGMGTAIMHLVSSIYIGYDSTFFGTLIGVFWGFVDGYIMGYLFSLIYNKIKGCC